MRFEDVLKGEVDGFDSLIESVVPRTFRGFDFGDLRWRCDVGAIDKAIANPIWDLLDRGGKRWRPILMKFCFEAVGGSRNIDAFLPLPEVIHNGTLMIDDIEDRSDLRRGKSCVHKIYGDDIAINAGNAMYYLPLFSVMKSDLATESKVRIYELVNEEMVRISFGQGMDIFWHGGNGLPSEDEYLQMCSFKTGVLARMAAKLGGILGGADDKTINALGEFAESLGVAFQIQDDILNIISSEKLGKDFGDDVSEGKRTLVLIRALECLSEDDARDLVGILNMKTKNRVLIGEAIRILKGTDAVDYAKSVALRLVEDAWNKLDDILEDCEAKSKLKMFSDFVVEREL